MGESRDGVAVSRQYKKPCISCVGTLCTVYGVPLGPKVPPNAKADRSPRYIEVLNSEIMKTGGVPNGWKRSVVFAPGARVL